MQWSSILPLSWRPIEQHDALVAEVVVDWLDREIESNAQLRLPLLAQLRGYRNSEVYQYIQQCFAERWYRELTEKLYGNMPFYTEGYLQER